MGFDRQLRKDSPSTNSGMIIPREIVRNESRECTQIRRVMTVTITVFLVENAYLENDFNAIDLERTLL